MSLLVLFHKVVRKVLKETKLFFFLWKLKGLRPFLWRYFAQPGELHFHQGIGSEYRLSEEFNAHSKLLFERYSLISDNFVAKCVLDIGAGSRLRTKYFDKAKLYVIEPLAVEYMSLPQSDLNEAEFVSSKPAEFYHSSLQEAMDLIVCLNVLDHCFDWVKVVENCYKYNITGGLFMLSVDLHDDKDPMHPIGLSESKLEALFVELGYTVLLKELNDGDYTHDITVTYILEK